MCYFASEKDGKFEKEKVRSAVSAFVPFDKMTLTEFEENIANLHLFDQTAELGIRNKLLYRELLLEKEER